MISLNYVFVISILFKHYETTILTNYWSFSGDLTDSAGSADLTVGQNAYFTEDRFGNKNSAIRLENGYLIAPPGVYFKDEFTFLAWIKLNSTKFYSRIIDFGLGSSQDNVEIAFYQGSKSIFLKTWYQEQGSDFLLSTKPITLKQWTHVAVSLSDGIGKIYLDGELVAKGILISPRDVSRTFNYIGKSNFGDPNVDATFDEIKIFARELNSSDILDEFNLNFTKSIIKNNTNLIITGTGLINYWPFNNSLSDMIGNSNLFGGYSIYYAKDRFYKKKSALDFRDGFVKFNTLYKFDTDFTIMAWVKLNALRHYARIFECGNGPGSDNIILTFRGTSAYIGFYIFNNVESSVQSSTELILNEWTHVAAVFENNVGYLYLNGKLNAKGSMLKPISVKRKNCFIGGSNWNHDGLAYATYDEIKLYDIALNESEIIKEVKDFNNPNDSKPVNKSAYMPVITKGLQNYWPFNGDTLDYAGNLHITDASSHEFDADRFNAENSAIYLSNGYMVVPKGKFFNGPFSLLLWFKLNYDTDSAQLIDFGISTYEVGGVGVSVSNKAIELEIFSRYSFHYDTATTTAPLSSWTHLAVCLDSNGFVEIYVNGKLESASTGIVPRRNISSRSKNYIGKYKSYLNSRYNSNTKYTSGFFDEIKIYNRSLTEYEVLEDFSYPNSFEGAYNHEPIHYWPFSNTYSDVNGKINVYYGSGFKITKDRFQNSKSALDLNKGYLKLSSDVYFGQELTITVWVYIRSHETYSRIIDFGNGEYQDNIILGFSGSSEHAYFEIHSGKYSKGHLIANKTVPLNNWIFIAAVLSRGIARLYYNCELVASGPQYMPKNVTRFSNFIGKSNWFADKYFNGVLDEIKIYNRPVSLEELETEFKQTQLLSGTAQKVLLAIAATATILLIVFGSILINKYIIKKNYFNRQLNLVFRNTNEQENLSQSYD